MRSKQARVATRSGLNFLPHHEPMIKSGSRTTYLLGCHDTVLGCALISTVREDVHPASDLDELGNPANSGDQRIVPLLEEYPWLLRQPLRTGSDIGQAHFERPYK